MSDDLDVISRLVDYHDHISVPSVPASDDLRRGRRRVRHHRGLAAGGVALAVASVVAAVSVATGGSADHTQPVGPSSTHSTSGPSPDGIGLSAPLLAPKSVHDVHELGFHVEPLPGFDPEGLGGGWAIDDESQTVTLWWREVDDKVTVNVRYQGAWQPDDPSLWPHPQRVMIHGVAGYYYEWPEGMSSDIGGDFEASLAWEYAPDAWAYVSAQSDRGDPGSNRLRSALIEVAEAVRPGSQPVRVPVRTDPFPASLPSLSRLTHMGMTMASNDGVHTGWEANLTFGQLKLKVGPGTVPQACGGYDGGVERFVYRGRAGCLSGYGTPDQPSAGTTFSNLNAVVLQVGDTVRTFEIVPDDAGNAPEYPVADLKRALADLTVAPLNDESTWFDLKTALGN
jgi:hypothetical protein